MVTAVSKTKPAAAQFMPLVVSDSSTHTCVFLMCFIKAVSESVGL